MPKEISTTKTENLSKKPIKKTRPDSVKIGPFKYDIYFKQKVAEAGKIKKKFTDSLGLTLNLSNIIEIKDDMTLPMEKDTVLHEILHAIWYTSGAASVDKMDEETTISLLTPWLLMFFENNPQVIEYLQTK